MKTIFITGTNSGIGLATARRFDILGWRVIAGVLPSDDTSELRANLSDNAYIIDIDITQAGDISKARQTIGKIIGDDGLHGLVNNAGIAVTGPIEALPMEAIRQQFEVNFFGHVAMTQALLPAIRQAKGRIVNITSILGRVTVPFSAPYCASKYAMEAYSDSLRMELMPDGIEVIIIEPTIIGTNIWTKQQTWQDEMMSELPPQQQAKYENRLKILRTTTDEQASLGESPDIIADTIQHAMTSKRPKARYTVGREANAFLFLAKSMPSRWRDQILMRRLHLWGE
jgi:NAD(P)-dependent dehydrogenase (short-subunit alcohol dehydrogenase family)